MSHFTKLNTQITNQAYLVKALQHLGYSPEEGQLHVRGFGGNRTEVDVRIPSKASHYDVGFHREGTHSVCVADWYGVRGIRQQEFLQSLTQQYASIAVKDQLAAQGFLLAEEKQVEGQIHLVLRRMV